MVCGLLPMPREGTANGRMPERIVDRPEFVIGFGIEEGVTNRLVGRRAAGGVDPQPAVLLQVIDQVLMRRVDGGALQLRLELDRNTEPALLLGPGQTF